VMISGSSVRSLELAPFLCLDPFKKSLNRHTPTEQELWEFLTKHKAIDGYMEFLRTKEA